MPLDNITISFFDAQLSCYSEWRRLAHRNGLVVASPTRLIGAERTFLGDSDDVSFGPKDYKLEPGLNGNAWILGGLHLSKKDQELLNRIGSDLNALGDCDIKDVRAPSGAEVEVSENERGRWEIMVSDTQRVGTVVRIGDGPKKRYLLHLWDGGWHRVHGQPPYDLPMFGLPDLRKDENLNMPVMVHEGPKAWWGAKSKAGNPDLGGLAGWLSRFIHVGWHGSDIGLEWTDWTPLRGRRVLIWPDMDEAGITNARLLGKRLALMGNVVEYVSWSVGDMIEGDTWDWGDEVIPHIHRMTRTDIKLRTLKIESPIDCRGFLNGEWLKRSFYDPERNEVYTFGRDYRPVPLANFVLPHSSKLKTQIADSTINPYLGLEFRPGIPFGKTPGGKINLCKPCIREPIVSKPLPRHIYEGIVRGWLRRMIPNVKERKHVIRKASVAIARPQRLSQQMLVLIGDSGIGKSVLLDLIIRIAGADRAVGVFPQDVLGKFNGQIMGKAIVCIHEIHSTENTRRENASRLKEVVANETITFEEKNRPRITVPNTIHWFAATNERAPVSLEHGNDRFYFTRCASPRNAKEVRLRDEFFKKWIPIFEDNAFLDVLYAGAKYYCENAPLHSLEPVLGRARRQEIWAEVERESRTAWQQYVAEIMETIEDQYAEKVEKAKGGEVDTFCFSANPIVNLVRKDYKMVGPDVVRNFLNTLGYRRVTKPDGSGLKFNPGQKGQGTLWVKWVKAEDLEAVQAKVKSDGGEWLIVIQPRLEASDA